jgi:hypothetical protein
LATAVVVTVVLIAPGVLTTSAYSGGPVSSDVAIAVANGFTNNTSGGPWSLVFVTGQDSTVGHSVTLSGFLGQHSGCNISGSANYTMPGYAGNYSDGKFTLWLLDYYNATGELEVAVVNGQVVAHLATWEGPCLPQNQPFVYSPIPSGVASSATAAAAVLQDPNVSAFVSTHSSVEASAFLSPWGLNSWGKSQLTWSFEYSACASYFTRGTPAEGGLVDAHANSTTGTLDLGSTYYDPNYPCILNWAGTLPPSDVFALGNPVFGMCPRGFNFTTNGCLEGDYTYTVPINTSYQTFWGLNFQVSDPGTPGEFYNLSSPGGFSILAPNGTVAARTNISAGSVMRTSFGFSYFGPGSELGVIPTTDTILLDMGTSDPAGLGLSLAATSSYFNGSTPPVTLP